MNIEDITLNGVPLINPKEIEIQGTTFLLTKIPMIPCRELFWYYSAGIEVTGDKEEIAQLSKLAEGNGENNNGSDKKQKTFFKIIPSAMADSPNTVIRLLSYCYVKSGENWIRLATPALINSHFNHVTQLTGLEMEMKEHNFSFFPNGKTSAS
jgi:hypothetical protein